MSASGWDGFDGRVFLTPEEHATYLRRPPVRYSRRGVEPHSGVCEVCGLEESVENPLQVSHRVAFLAGVRHFWLTPEWLDSARNLVWAHKRTCNKAAEITHDEIGRYLQSMFGIDVVRRTVGD